MKAKEVFDYFGSQANTAKALGISQPSVSRWAKNNAVPELMQYKIQILTKNKLKADTHE
jgi:predicted XRE-type DNA-binding protein